MAPEECQHHFLLIATFWISWFIPGQVIYTMPQLTSSLQNFCDLYYNIDPSLSPLLAQVLLRQSMTDCQLGLLSL
jgi:hypothetical protein